MAGRDGLLHISGLVDSTVLFPQPSTDSWLARCKF